MIATPSRKEFQRYRVGLVTRGRLAIGDWGTCHLRDVPDNAILFVHREADLWDMLKRGYGSALMKRSRFLRFKMYGRDVVELREKLAAMHRWEALEALQEWAEWIMYWGGRPGSIAGSSWSIWKRTLPTKLLLGSRTFPIGYDNLVIGGRQDSRKGYFKWVSFWDMRAAYQAAMRDVLVSARYKETRHIGEVGFAHANVEIPPSEWGCLPINDGRRMIFPQRGPVEGVWDFAELRTAIEAGAKVTINQAWSGQGMRLPWRKWSEIMTSGRELSGAAGSLAKMTANSLWGSFASDGGGAWVEYQDNRLVKVRDLSVKTPACAPVAAHITSHVRSRLYLEALAMESDVIAVHTDSVVLPAHLTPSGPMGNEIGEWRLEHHAADLHMLNAQIYRWKGLSNDETWNHVAAGCPPEFAHHVFNGAERRAVRDALRLEGKI